MQISIKAKGINKLQDNLKNISNKAKNTAPLMAELANHLYNVTDRSFENQSSPDGISWNPLKASTLKTKKKNQSKILYREGDMQESLNVESSNDTASVGLNATKDGYPYPIVHQFGRLDGTMDARPFLPIHDDDTLYDNIAEELEEIVEDYIKEGNLLK